MIHLGCGVVCRLGISIGNETTFSSLLVISVDSERFNVTEFLELFPEKFF